MSFWLQFTAFHFGLNFLLHSSSFCYGYLCFCSVISPFFSAMFILPSYYTYIMCCCHAALLVPPSFTPVSRPCEREGVRRLRHSLGCFSTLVPWAEKPPSPLQPLSLRSPDPTSWYSGFCPCLPGTVFSSSPSHGFRLLLLCLLTSSYPSIYCGFLYPMFPFMFSLVQH